MKQVWKCDFCSQTSRDKMDGFLHEKKCSFNPENKTCMSCRHHMFEGAPISGYSDECNLNVKNHEDISEDNLSCEFWEGKK